MLAGHVFAGQTVSVGEQAASYGADLKRMTAQVSVCRGWRYSRFELAPCVGVAVEYMSARGTGAGVAPSTQGAVWPAPGAGGVAHWYAMESLALFASVSGYLELSRPHLIIEGLGEVAQPGLTAVEGAMGLEWSF
jgi:hypothetical protein